MEKSAQIEVMSGVNRLIPDYALLERFVNLPDLLARVEGDRDLLAELLMMFQQEIPALQGALHCAMDVGDLPEAAKMAHAFKGMLASLSMVQGASMATTIEAAARAGDVPKIKETLAVFDAEMVALSAAVDAFRAGISK